MKIRFAFAVAVVLAFCGCDRMPGRPGAHEEVARPEQVLDFSILYKENCSGCHGVEGKGGASIALRDPVYLAIADDATIRGIASGGVAGTQMPPFAQSKGGMLTDAQIGALVTGIRAWARADVGNGIPPYSAQSPGDPQRGAGVYATFCASCHGPDGEGAKGGSAIASGTYLSLVSDQYLRTVVIAGRPELGAPDWRGNVDGRAMTSGEISDVVAWLASRRSAHGRPTQRSTSK
jgi:mono/diheme cytochrome c family protein